MNQRGFSLIELLIYTAVLAIVAGLFTSILATTTKVQLKEVSNTEVSNQLTFVTQTIQRLVRESSQIETVGANNSETEEVSEVSFLKLRMPELVDDPTCITLVDEGGGIGGIHVTVGAGDTASECKNADLSTDADRITTDRVRVPLLPTPGLLFMKLANYPGKDAIDFELTLAFNAGSQGLPLTRTLQSAVGRASAATFDSDVTAPSGGTLNLGTVATPWKDLYVNNIKGAFTQPDNFGGARGQMVLTTIDNSCNTICGNHGLICFTGLAFKPVSGVGTALEAATCSDTYTTYSIGGFCLCE